MASEPVKSGTIDGVPVFWVPDDGPTDVGMVFRGGMVHERFPQRGLTHLVEHLSLHSVDRELSFNGAVDLTNTTLLCRGTPDEAAQFVREVTASLANLPFARLDSEVKVLRAEANQRSTSTGMVAMNVMYGAAGPGGVLLPEAGLWVTAPETVDAWRRRMFTRHNVAVFGSGPMPADLSFDQLPDGDPIPPVVAERIIPAGTQLFSLNMEGVAAFAEMPRGPETSVACLVAHERLTEVLREEKAISYGVIVDMAEINDTHVWVQVSADATAEDSEAAFECMRVELRKLATEGPTQDEIDAVLRKMARGLEHTDVGTAIGMARTHLAGRPLSSNQQWLEKCRAVTASQIAERWSAFDSSALWLVPLVEVRDRRLQWVERFSTSRATGPGVEAIYFDETLFVDDERLTVIIPEDKALTVSVDSLAGVTAFLDGGYQFFGGDGFNVTILPTDFPGMEAKVAEFVARVPADLIRPIDRPLRTPEQAAQMTPKPKKTLRGRLRERINAAGAA